MHSDMRLPREVSHNNMAIKWWRVIESIGRIIRLWRREEKISVGMLIALVK